MTYEDLQRENRAILKRMEELTALILAVELDGRRYEYGVIREILQIGTSRADGYRRERKELQILWDENMEKLEVFLMTAERREQLYEILTTKA